MADEFNKDGIEVFPRATDVAQSAEKLTAVLNAISRAALREPAAAFDTSRNGAMENKGLNIFVSEDDLAAKEPEPVASVQTVQSIKIKPPLRYRRH